MSCLTCITWTTKCHLSASCYDANPFCSYFLCERGVYPSSLRVLLGHPSCPKGGCGQTSSGVLVECFTSRYSWHTSAGQPLCQPSSGSSDKQPYGNYVHQSARSGEVFSTAGTETDSCATTPCSQQKEQL